jgi:uncharacterized damage-inducible protein DinB
MENQQQTMVYEAPVINKEETLEHWQGHRRLTRKAIEAFPEKELFSFSIGGMRTAAGLFTEMLSMASPGAYGFATRDWAGANVLSKKFTDNKIESKEELLRLWDESTEDINRYWADILPERFHDTDMAFEQWEGKVYWTLFYLIDNEIHHRGQATVYLRALGVEPPPFWER